MNKKEKLIDFVLCLTLGYLGIHKFYEKKTGLGIIYLFTLGIFGIGWIIDIIKLLMDLINEFTSSNNNFIADDEPSYAVHSSEFDTNVSGVTFENRQELLKKCSVNQKIYIKWEKNNPYSKTGHALAVFTNINNEEKQLGYIPDGKNEILFKKHAKEFNNNNDFTLEGRIDKITGGSPNKPSLGCVIKI